jgi:hypothetical protein
MLEGDIHKHMVYYFNFAMDLQTTWLLCMPIKPALASPAKTTES